MMLKRSKGLTWPFLGLALASLIVFLAGLAAVQRDCGAIPTGSLRQQGNGGLFGRSAFGASDSSCHRMFRFYWFIFAFVLATLLGLLVCAALRLALHWSRAFWVAMLAISAVLMMITSEFLLGADNAFDSQGVWPDWLHRRWRTAAAGAIMSVVSLILLMMAIGTDWDRYGHRSHGNHDEKATPVHTTTTTTEYVAHPVGNVRVVDAV